MKKLNYLLILLALILAGCSGNSSTSPDNGDSSSLSSSSIGVIPEMSSIAPSSSSENRSAGSSVVAGSSSSQGTSSIGTSSQGTSSITQSSSSVIAVNAPIALYKIGGLAKTLNVTNAMNAIPYNVDLDTIRGTASFSFLVKNNSTSDITGLSFKFDLDYFKVTPDSIITLGAPSSATGIEQLIKVTVEHGTLASGYGFTNVLTGNQYGKLTISGHNDDGDFSVTYTMHVYAKRMILTIDVPDTVMIVNNWYVNRDTVIETPVQTNNQYMAQYHPSYRYVHVDPSSGDCYLNLGEITLDTSVNLMMPDMKDYYTTFYKKDGLTTEYNPNGYGNVLKDSSATGIAKHIKLFTELNGAKRLESYNFMDNNCVVLVNDNWPVTNVSSEVGSEWVKTQRIID